MVETKEIVYLELIIQVMVLRPSCAPEKVVVNKNG
jgi:hypothetical protein